MKKLRKNFDKKKVKRIFGLRNQKSPLNLYKMNGIKVEVINGLRTFLQESVTKSETYFSKPTDFSRSGKLGLAQTAVCSLFLLKKSLKIELDDFFDILDKDEDCCTASAFSQSRYKLQPVFFKDWQEGMSQNYLRLLEQAGILQTWRGLQFHALDGTTAYLFNGSDVGSTFGYHSNQHGVKMPMARAVVRYDVLNKVAVSGVIDRMGRAEKVMARRNVL